MAQTTRTRARMSLFGFVHIASHLGGQNPQNPNFGVWIGVFKPNSRNRKCNIIKTSASIPTKFCTMIKNTKCLSWVVPTHALQIQDGAQPPSWKKIEKSPYLGRGSSDFDEIWYDDAVRPFWPLQLLILKIQDGGRRHLKKFKNHDISATVRPIAKKFGMVKIKKSPYLDRGFSDFDEIWHGDAVGLSWPFKPLQI